MIMHMTIFTYTRWQIINLSLKYEQIYSKYRVQCWWPWVDQNTFRWKWSPNKNLPLMEATVNPSPQVTVSTTFPVRPPPTRQIPLRRRKSPTPSCPYLLDPNVNKCPYTKKMNVFCIAGNHRSLDPSQLNSIIFSKKMTSSGKILYVWRTSVELGIENESK